MAAHNDAEHGTIPSYMPQALLLARTR